ncbi:MAG: hypothetical protein JW986_01165 [Methanotrichaceae archaeon]|nr:hypothetical protein [Methanotrichaceae archaeon]
MEIWQIVVICILMLPIFFLANYLIVRSAVKNRKETERRLELAAAMSVNRSLKASKNPRDKYRHRKR